jgi:hypothetical protein
MRERGGFRVEAPARASKGFTQGDGTQRLERMLQQVLLANFRLECRAWQECVRVLYALMPSQTDESGLGAWLHMRLARLLEAQGHRGGVERRMPATCACPGWDFSGGAGEASWGYAWACG